MSLNLDKFSKLLAELSGYRRQALISREIFEKHVISHCKTASKYLWIYYSDKEGAVETISEELFVRKSEHILGIITDKDQIQFYLKVFSKGKEMIAQSSFMDFLRSAFVLYQLTNRILITEDDSDLSSAAALSWMDAVSKSVFHIKTEMSVCFITNWILTNIPRMLNPMHKYTISQLTIAYGQLKLGKGSNSSIQVPKNEKTGEAGSGNVGEKDPLSLIHPVLMWLLRTSLPAKYLSVLDRKPEPHTMAHHHACTSSQQLMQMLGGENCTSESWALLYDSDDQGLSVNRFQHHIFNYRGPTLIFVKADNDYLFCIASDIEWRESCHFWGGEESILLMVKPEFHVVEKGTKLLYANFSIRGYPFGIQVGKDPRNVSIEIKPEFNYVTYKKMPCKILRLLAWGCAPPQIKVSQQDLRKWEEKQAEKNRKINLNNPEWKDNPDKYLLELAGNYRSYDNQ